MHLIIKNHACYNIMSAIASLIATYKRYALVYQQQHNSDNVQLIKQKFPKTLTFNIDLFEENSSCKQAAITAKRMYTAGRNVAGNK